MNCLIARKILLAGEPHDQLVGTEQLLRAKQHVLHCHNCQLFLAQEDGLRRVVRSKLQATPALPDFRERILTSIGKERQKKSVKKWSTLRSRASVLGAAAVLVIALLAYDVLFRPTTEFETDGMSSPVHTLIQDHIATKVKEHPLDLVTSDRAELEQWFARRVDFSVTIPRLHHAKLMGGRLCLIGGKRAVSLSWEQQDVPITLYIVDRSVIDPTALRPLASINKKSVFHADAKGCNLILWEDRGLVYCLVSDLSTENLLQLIGPCS